VLAHLQNHGEVPRHQKTSKVANPARSPRRTAPPSPRRPSQWTPSRRPPRQPESSPRRLGICGEGRDDRRPSAVAGGVRVEGADDDLLPALGEGVDGGVRGGLGLLQEVEVGGLGGDRGGGSHQGSRDVRWSGRRQINKQPGPRRPQIHASPAPDLERTAAESWRRRVPTTRRFCD